MSVNTAVTGISITCKLSDF